MVLDEITVFINNDVSLVCLCEMVIDDVTVYNVILV